MNNLEFMASAISLRISSSHNPPTPVGLQDQTLYYVRQSKLTDLSIIYTYPVFNHLTAQCRSIFLGCVMPPRSKLMIHMQGMELKFQVPFLAQLSTGDHLD